jgi:predicted alpha/beta hydrolase
VAFVLANKGYDVWLGNIRGNRYSNAALSPNVRDYWDFSFDELARYDLTSSFKYIANKTGQKIHYVGHSQGTLIMFIALAANYTNIRQNLATFTALGPIVYINDMDSPLLNRLMNTKTF